MSGRQWLFGFHAVGARLKVAPESVHELHVDAARRDGRMRALRERAQETGVRLTEADDARLTALCHNPRHQEKKNERL